ncbi:MAG: ABC transporter ATP-binding protein, partial [Acidobacteriota bacterium]
MNAFHEEESLGKIYDHRLARRLLQYLRPYRWIVFLSVVLLTIASSFRLIGPLLTEIAIDDHIQKGDTAGLGRIALLYLGV